MTNYQKLVTKFDKEKRGDASAKAANFAELHASELDAEIALLKAERIRANNKIKKAKIELEMAEATLTDNTRDWMDLVEVAELELSIANKHLEEIDESISTYTRWKSNFIVE